MRAQLPMRDSKVTIARCVHYSCPFNCAEVHVCISLFSMSCLLIIFVTSPYIVCLFGLNLEVAQVFTLGFAQKYYVLQSFGI